MVLGETNGSSLKVANVIHVQKNVLLIHCKTPTTGPGTAVHNEV